MQVQQFERERFAPWFAGDGVNLGEGQRLRHGVEIVEESLGAHAGVFFEGVIFVEPIDDGFDAGIVFIHVGVDVTEKTGVADAAVGTEGHAAIGKGVAPSHRIARVVDETAKILRIAADPFLFVVGRKVLAIGEEVARGFEIEFGLVGRVGGVQSADVKGFERGERVAHVGMFIFAAIADAAIEGRVDTVGFTHIDLRADEVAACVENCFAVGRQIARDESEQGEGGVVIGHAFFVDAAVGFDVLGEEIVAPREIGRETRIVAAGFGIESDEDKGGDCGLVGVGP